MAAKNTSKVSKAPKGNYTQWESFTELGGNGGKRIRIRKVGDTSGMSVGGSKFVNAMGYQGYSMPMASKVLELAGVKVVAANVETNEGEISVNTFNSQFNSGRNSATLEGKEDVIGSSIRSMLHHGTTNETERAYILPVLAEDAEFYFNASGGEENKKNRNFINPSAKESVKIVEELAKATIAKRQAKEKKAKAKAKATTKKAKK